MKIVTEAITIKELQDTATDMFGNLVKAVVDVEKEIIEIVNKLVEDDNLS
jgi:division protein CdvB (Snf7/Vps24/ESCRT-III family)